jgi:hypothetical protein
MFGNAGDVDSASFLFPLFDHRVLQCVLVIQEQFTTKGSATKEAIPNDDGIGSKAFFANNGEQHRPFCKFAVDLYPLGRGTFWRFADPVREFP